MLEGLLKRFEKHFARVVIVESTTYKLYLFLEENNEGTFECFHNYKNNEFIKLSFNEIPFDKLFPDADISKKIVLGNFLKFVDVIYRDFTIRFEREQFYALQNEKLKLLDLLISYAVPDTIDMIGTSLQFDTDNHDHVLALDLSKDTFFAVSHETKDLIKIIVETLQEIFQEIFKVRETTHKIIVTVGDIKLTFFKSDSCVGKFQFKIKSNKKRSD